MSLAWTRRARSAASSLDPASSSTSLPRRWSASHAAAARSRAVSVSAALDPAVPVVDGDHAGLPGPQPYRRGGFPRRGEAADLGQLRRRNLRGQEPEHAAGFGCAELLGVADQDDPGACGAGCLEEHGEVGGAGLGGLVDHQDVAGVHRDGAAELVAAFGLAEELGDVVGLGQPLASPGPGRRWWRWPARSPAGR